MEAGEIVKAAFITYLLHVHAVFDQQFAGMADPDLTDELGVGLPGSRFKIPAK